MEENIMDDRIWMSTQPVVIMERYRFELTEHGVEEAQEWLHNAHLQDLVNHGVRVFRGLA
jgi:hypothetical protein